MIPIQFDYMVPKSVAEAVQQLRANPKARVLAGGQSLLPAMKLRRVAPALLLDLGKIEELRQLKEQKGAQVSAMVTYTAILADKRITERYQALAEALQSITDPQVRHCGTIGGSLAYNDPAGDLPAVALALEAVINTIGPDGARSLPADAFLTGEWTTALKPGELIVSVDFPESAAGTGSAYEKFKNPASGYAICGIAAKVTKASDGTVKTCRVAVTGAAESAVRLRKVEASLEGQKPTADRIAAAAKSIAAEKLTFGTDLAASAEYRAHLTQVLTERALARAVK